MDIATRATLAAQHPEAMAQNHAVVLLDELQELSVSTEGSVADQWRAYRFVGAAGMAVSDSTRRRKSSYSSPVLSDRAASE